MRSLVYNLWLLPLLLGVTESISCGNVTINTGQDAVEVRKGCKVITGNLVFASDFAETIHLDGVEEVQGYIAQANECRFDGCTTPPPFSISSSTLHTVGDSVAFWQFLGLQELSLPNLTRVEGQVLFGRMYNLERLDITKLSRFEAFLLEADNLTSLSHEVLEGFTRDQGTGPFVEFGGAAIDSVDSFYKRPIALPDEGKEIPPRITLSSYALPNLRNVTIGWSKVHTVKIYGNQMSVTFGNSNTTTMEIKNLELDGNFTKLEYLVDPVNLTVHRFSIGSSDSSLTHLDLPFHNTSTIDITNQSSLKSIRIPPGAQGWEDFDLSIYSCPNLNLTSEYSGDERVWYWPQRDMKAISILDVPISNDFFASFLASHANGTQGPKVRSFSVRPKWAQEMKFDCTPFEQLRLRGVFPEYYHCTNSTSESQSIGGEIPSLWFLGMGLLFYILL